ncbi:MAG: MBL fold metallo-hydrolase [Deltaproteobacteria bacterium]|nr:MBL fold metallo-hydrolase [Deltaproteobacteria bacterium]
MEFGDFRIHPVSDGFFRLDGGAMFGVVPKTIWEKTNPSDEKNRVLLGLNPLLIQTSKENILIDTGIGTRNDERFNSIYGVERKPTLVESLNRLGLKPEDITIVINTHLHFDHAGGNTIKKNDSATPAFPNARYIVQKGEWEAAVDPNERTRASYLKEDFEPVMEAGLFELIEGDREIVKGISVFRASGHNRDIQLVKIQSKGQTAVYLSDIIPTVTHLKYPYIMGYDLFPLETLKIKKELIEQAARERWLLIFEHDPNSRMGYVSIKDSNPVFEKVI